jgi:hypothetical protein
MRRPSRSFIETAGAVVAALCVAFVLEVPLGPSRGAEVRPAVSASEPVPAIQAPAIQVNRALKGDRLQLIVRPDGGGSPDVRLPRNPTRSLPDGCESAFGPINPSTKPSRCVT